MGARGDRAGRRLDRAGDDRMCGVAGADRAGTVSYLHMHMFVARHGQPGWVAALTPLSADRMIVAASTTLLADSRSGRNGGALSWALLVAGSVANLAANVAVAEPPLVGRVIAARLRLHRLPRGAPGTSCQYGKEPGSRTDAVRQLAAGKLTR